MLELIRRKIQKIVAVLKEDENHPIEAQFLLGKKGTKYQHATVRIPIPEGYSLEYWWVCPGIDTAKCTVGHPLLSQGDFTPMIDVEIRKPLDYKGDVK